MKLLSNLAAALDGGRPILFASVAQWPAGAEFFRYDWQVR
jgi:hypothetical protein